MKFMIVTATKSGRVLTIDGKSVENKGDIVRFLDSLSNGILKKENMWNVCSTTTIHDENGAERVQYTLSRYPTY